LEPEPTNQSRKLSRIFTLLFIAVITGSTIVVAQENTAVSEKANAYYDKIYGVDQRLVSGEFNYGPMYGSIAGHPYFIGEEWKKGSALLDGILFTNLSLRYDIYQNQIVMYFIARENAPYHLSLNKNRIERFWMDNRLFVPFPRSRDSLNRVFCEVMAEGDADYLVLVVKEMVLTNGSGMTDFEYKETIKQYLYVDEVLIPFTSKRALFRLNPEEKRNLKDYIRQNRLTMRRSDLANRAKLVSHYNFILSNRE